MDKTLCCYKLSGYYEKSEYYRITNLESYDGPLPNDKFFKPTSWWRLWINYKLQPQNDIKLWRKFQEFLTFKIVYIPELQKRMDRLLIKISSGYVRRYEITSSKNVPFALIKLIAIPYLIVEISIFNDVYFLEDCGQFVAPYSNSPKGQKIKWKNVFKQNKNLCW